MRAADGAANSAAGGWIIGGAALGRLHQQLDEADRVSGESAGPRGGEMQRRL